ncbi:hypothetical protein H8E88_16205 [candidate division KSB1 bacterium]|nr:hypothetical protein [candidate division KSB1 bacterium]MBL7094621.1 hypothetical protein [candidate division KSB1 bacterium]
MKLLITIIFGSFLCLYSCDIDKSLLSCDDEFGYDCWPRNGTIKHNIELPVNHFQSYKLELRPGFNDSTIHFDLPLFDDDSAKNGRFNLDIYQTIEKAQLSLLDFIYAIQSRFKPPRLSKSEFPFGDVSFGEEKEGIFFVFFTRDNVRILIDAPANITKELAQKIDNIILNSPAWQPGNPKPSFIITNEFLQAFLVEPK